MLKICPTFQLCNLSRGQLLAPTLYAYRHSLSTAVYPKYRYHLALIIIVVINKFDFSSVYPVLFLSYWRGGSGSQRIHVTKTGTFTTHKVRRPKLRR